MSVDKLMKMFEESRKTIGYAMASATIDFTEEICSAMQDKNIGRKELAEKCGITDGYLKSILGDDEVTENLKLKDMVKIMHVLGYTLTISKEEIV